MKREKAGRRACGRVASQGMRKPMAMAQGVLRTPRAANGIRHHYLTLSLSFLRLSILNPSKNTGTTTRGCAGGSLKVRLELRERAQLARRKKLVGGTVCSERGANKKCDEPLSFLSRHVPAPRTTPSRASFCHFLAERRSLLCAPCFAISLKRKRARKDGCRQGAKQRDSVRIRSARAFFFFPSLEKRNFQVSGEENAKPLPRSPPVL